MSCKPYHLRLGLVLGFLLASAGLGLPVALPAATLPSLSGTYNCATLEVAGTTKPCTAPSLELKPDGSYKLLSESGNYEIVGDRKSTRLNSSHSSISYAVFCLK